MDRWTEGEEGGSDREVIRWRGLCPRKTRETRNRETGQPVRVEQVGSRLFLRGLPVANPDPIAQVPVIKLECASRPRQPVDWGYEDPGE